MTLVLNQLIYTVANLHQVIKTFSILEGWWYIGIKDDGGVKSKRTRLLILNKNNVIDLY